ncbi:YncE family protein [Chitinophaga rhizosphaerae]|uniref:YncE family protein n=1 Tax=Chitinophaga rhizosphaerae TaxID=1864947 RepID=UPI000F80DEFB|nr:YncE family protein [Chitinophaga rhizosphaerae]
METLQNKLPQLTHATEASQGTLPQLSFEMGNPSAANTIYITTDPAVNKLSLAITLNIGDATFTPGELVPKSDAPKATGSILYLDLSALQLTAAEFGALACAATGWQFELFPEDDLICMTPTKNITLGSGAGDAINIAINGLTMSNPPAAPNASLNVSCFRVSPASSGKLPEVSFFKVLLQNAPDGQKDLNAAIGCELNSASDIFNSIDGYDPVMNSISFIFKPGPSPAVVKAGPKTVFTVSFVYAADWPGYGALTTPASAAKIKVRQGQNAGDWVITQNADQQNPCWLMVPPDGQPIIGTGTKSVVQIDIDQIVTTFEPGPTLMFVQYQDVPGYNDGSYYILLNKIPHVAIDNITITPNPAIVQNGVAEVTVSWSAKNFKLLTLMPFYEDVTKVTSYKALLTETTDITLVANGAGGPSNTVMKTVTANVLPEINSFVATPTAIYKKDFPHDVKFYWDVDTNEAVYLVNVRDNTKEPVDKSGTLYKSVKNPGMWSIVPKNSAKLYELQRSVLIQAFDQEPRNVNIDFVPKQVVASPDAQFVAAINQSANSVEILNSLTYDRYTDPIRVGGKPVDILFSTNGKYLYSVEDNGTLTVIGVTYNERTASYSFGIVCTVPLDNPPAHIAVGPDEDYVFVTCNDTEDQQGHLIVIEKLSDTVFSVKNDVSVGLSAMGLATDPTGALVYVANAGSNNVSVVGYSSLDDSFNFIRNISDLDSQPVDVAVGDPTGDTLLVVCKGSNKLIAVHHDDRGSSLRQELPLGNSPMGIDTDTSRAYAFVTNAGSNTVTLVSCGAGVSNCKILEAGIPTVNIPAGISLSTDDAMVFAASSTDPSLTVIKLINYQMQNAPVKVGNLPTDVVISNDNKSVVSWHNALITIGKGTYSKGLYVYNVATGAVVNKMNTTDVIGCVFSPQIPVKKLFLIASADDSVEVLDATTFASQLKIPIPTGTGGVTRQPINISMSAAGDYMYLVVKEATGQHALVTYACDVNANIYTVVSDNNLFVSTVKSNTILLANTPDGSAVFVLDAFAGNIYTINRDAGGTYQPSSKIYTITSIAKSMVVSPDNGTVYILAQTNMMTSFLLIDIAKQELREYKYPDSYGTVINLQRLCISPDGSRLFITDADITGVRVVSTESLRIVQTLSWERDLRYPMGITMLPDASSIYLACVNSNNIAQVFQINS